MKQLVFLLCLCTSLTSHAQIHTFEDYSNCYIGFMKGADTLWPAQFESVVEDPNPHSHGYRKGWLVEFHGRWGYLGEEGTIEIPITYDELQFIDWFDGFLAAKNGLRGVINLKNEVVIPLIYDELELDFGNYYVREQPIQMVQQLIFITKVRKGKTILSGASDYKGKKLIPNIYADISISDIEIDTGIVARYFVVEDTLRKSGLYSQNGELLLPCEYDGISIFCLTLPKALSTPYAKLWKENKTAIFNLETKTKSAYYKDIVPLRNIFIFETKRGWGACDTNFNELGKIVSGQLNGINIYGTNANEFLEIDSYKNIGGPVLVIYRYNPEIIEEDGLRVSRYNELGLINLKLGKKTNMDYLGVKIQMDEKDTFYWCFKHSDWGRSTTLQVDIYDVNLNKKSELQLFKESSVGMADEENKIIILRDVDGKWGAVLADGTVHIPFQQDEYEELYRLEGNLWKCSYPIFKQDSIKRIYNQSGNLLYTGKIREIWQEKDNWMVNHGEKKSLLDSLFQPILEEFDYFALTNPENGHGYSALIARNRELYGIKNKSMELLPDTCFAADKRKEIRIFENHFLLDPANKVLDAGTINQEEDWFFVMRTEGRDKNKNTYNIWSKEGERILHLENIIGAQKIRKEIRIIVGDKQVGIWSLESKKWILKPNYGWINPTENKNAYWVNEAGKNGYTLVNEWEEKILPQRFDEPFSLNNTHTFRIIINRKYGLMNPQLETVLEAEYDKLEPYSECYYLRKNNRWGFYIENQEMIPPQFDWTTRNLLPDKIMVFKGDSLAMFTSALKPLIPLAPIEKVIQESDLLSLIGIEKLLQLEAYQNFIIPKKGNAYRLINNRNLVNFLLANSKKDMTASSYSGHLWNRYTNFDNKHFCSIFIENKDNNLPVNQKIHFLNYRIKNDTFAEVSIKELLKTDEESYRQFRKLLTNEVNRRQFFGPQCVNLEEKLNQLERQFQLNKEGIRFHDRIEQYRYVQLTWEQIRPILQNPELFKP